jgi:diguanylate cyclase (GGDEF)-like protein
MTDPERIGRAPRTRRHRRVIAPRSWDAANQALRSLLETGIPAASQLEAAQAVASCAARTLHFTVSCCFLVGDDGRIGALSTAGITPARAAALRSLLIGEDPASLPVWRRAFSSTAAPDLVGDTHAPSATRPGGLATVLGLRSLVGIPLYSHEGPLGFAVTGGSVPRPRWSPSERAAIVDNARLRALERHDATHDLLTGLLNRRGFLEEYERELAAAVDQAGRLAVLVMDIDGLKEINDELGHQMGDQLLVAFARCLKACVRDGDLVARLGGDEFAAVLTDDVGPELITTVVDRIQARLRYPITLAGTPTLLKASIGVAMSDHPGASAHDLLSRADQAMYTAKRTRPDSSDAPVHIAVERRRG